jgi:hypothetical protein
MRYLLFFGLCLSMGLSAQPTALGNGFRYAEGVYLDAEQFANNKPHMRFEDMPTLEIMLDQEKNVLHVSYSTGDTKIDGFPSLDSLWGLCWQGQPYIRVSRDPKSPKEYIYVHLHVTGRISYFYYDGYVYMPHVYSVYHPQTGLLVTKRQTMVREPAQLQKVLLPETGEILDFSVETFREIMKNDPDLLKALDMLPHDNQEKYLFRILLIYNDRHPLVRM